MKQYNNYHRHTDYSSIYMADSCVKPEDYAKRIKELGYGSFFTTEHGYGGSIFESKKVCEKYGLKCIFGMEGYIVPNPLEKDKANYHIVIIPKTNKARKKLNKASSKANKEGFYYRPRLFLSDLLAFDSNELFITTACIGGLLADDRSINEILIPLIKHFGNNVFLEVQSHNNELQKNINKKAIDLSSKFNCSLIAANDSHYIYESQKKDRDSLMVGKKAGYGEEDNFMLDFPDYETLYSRFIIQGVLSTEQIKNAIENTLIFDECEEIDINKEIKMPNIYPNLSLEERHNKLKSIINHNFAEIIKRDKISKEELPKYLEAIRYEMKIIEDTAECRTVDYFLLNERIVDLAVNKYNGILTKTGRGSNSGFYINRILHITEIDRLRSEIPLYPERFMSVPRIIEEHSLPDNDYNTADPQPFIDASKELLGDTGCYWMISYGTMQEAEAFRNVCRSKNLKFEEYNEIAKDIESYRDKEPWKELIDYSQNFNDVIVSASVHPCSNLLMDKDIEEEVGVIKIGEFLCAVITSSEADEWKYLKNDYLTVQVLSLISNVFKSLNKPIMSLRELKDSIDDKVWELYYKGLTCTINQVDGDWTTKLVKQYKPTNIEELAKFTGAIRPNFEAFRDDWINRKPYSCGISKIDELFKVTDGRVLFQENLIQFFEWLGVSPANSIGIIKKISKKKIKPEDFQKLESGLREHWVKYMGSDDHFDVVWNDIQSNMGYGYNSPHAISMAYDSIYCAYLKSHYPIQYYTVALSMYANDKERTNKLVNEMKTFNIDLLDIKFRKSVSDYRADIENNAIYRGIGSIKYLNAQIGDELYDLRNNQYKTFTECLFDIFEKTSCNSKQMQILIGLGYFDEFGENAKLLEVFDKFLLLRKRKTIKVAELKDLALTDEILKPFVMPPKVSKNGKTQADIKQYTICNMKALIEYFEGVTPNKSLDISEQLKLETDYLGFCQSIYNCSDDYYFIQDIDTKYSPVFTLYNLANGKVIKVKAYKKSVCYKGQMTVAKYDIMQVSKIETKKKRRLINEEWVELDEEEEILTGFAVIKHYESSISEIKE